MVSEIQPWANKEFENKNLEELSIKLTEMITLVQQLEARLEALESGN